jgi:hypothetical protein
MSLKIKRTVRRNKVEVIVSNVYDEVLRSYTFDTNAEAIAFIRGWTFCQEVTNRIMEQMKITYDDVKR